MFEYSRLLDLYYITPENLRTLTIAVSIGALVLAVFVISFICEFISSLINLPKEKKAAKELEDLRAMKEKYTELRALVLSDPNLRSVYAELLADDVVINAK